MTKKIFFDKIKKKSQEYFEQYERRPVEFWDPFLVPPPTTPTSAWAKKRAYLIHTKKSPIFISQGVGTMDYGHPANELS